jgi:hypothetical protein
MKEGKREIKSFCLILYRGVMECLRSGVPKFNGSIDF